MYPKVILKSGREKSVLNRHPWIFSGAIAEVDKKISDNPQGQFVDVWDDEKFLARGFFNPHSQIRVRIFTWNEHENIGEKFWQQRVETALSLRDILASLKNTNAKRLINSESDGFSGLIVDQYDRTLVLQVTSRAVHSVLPMLVAILDRKLRPQRIFEKSDDKVRKLEGLDPVVRWHKGEASSEPTLVEEDNHKFCVDLQAGHKSGFYLDQRDNRRVVRNLELKGEALNCFSYTGGFSVALAVAGASHVTNIDSSEKVLQLCRANMEFNFPSEKTSTQFSYICGDVFEELRKLDVEGRRFETIVLDPPKFAQNSSQVKAACRGYKDLNRLGFKLLQPGGYLFTFSCSGLIDLPLFQKVVFQAAAEASCDGQIIQVLKQAEDHGVLLSFPESFYLKGFLIRKY